MIPIEEIFSKTELKIYENLPLPTIFYLIDDNEIRTILLSKGVDKLFHLEGVNSIADVQFDIKNKVHPDDQERVKTEVNNFILGKFNDFSLSYRNFNQETNSYMWISAQGYILDLESKYRVAMITFQSTEDQIRSLTSRKSLNLNTQSEYFEVRSMLESIVQVKNDFVLKIDELQSKVILFASDFNFAHFEYGYNELTYEEYEAQVENNIISVYGKYRLLDCQSLIDTVKKSTFYSSTVLVKCEGKFAYKKFNSFRDKKDNILYTVVSEVTDIVSLEQEKKKILEDENKAQTKFLQRMSHDMRTPLGAIMSEAKFGIEETQESFSKEYFKQIFSSSEYLLSIMNDILDVQKLNSGIIALNREVFLITELNKSVLNIVEIKSKSKNITVRLYEEIKDDVYVKLDKHRVNQILVNLLHNSIKYTRVNGLVTLSSRMIYVDDVSYLEYIISDNGVGMSKEFQDYMFEPFSKEQNELSRSEEGTGLGLSIVKNIIDINGGSIRCISNIGEGTKFIIRLQLVPFSEKEVESVKKTTKYYDECRLINKKVLLVEDVEINVKIAKKILESKKLIVSVANNGKEAVKYAKENYYDIILMDIRMPKMNGIEASKAIRKFNKNIPIIALSANAYVEDVRLSLDAGMNGHLSKPIDKDVLTKVILDSLPS